MRRAGSDRSEDSRGCNQLIRDGALLLSSVDDLLNELAYECQLPQLEDWAGEEVDIEILNADESVFKSCFRAGKFWMRIGLAGRSIVRSLRSRRL